MSDWLNQQYGGSGGKLRPGWWTADVHVHRGGAATEDAADFGGVCPWSLEVEALRTLLGVGIAALW